MVGFVRLATITGNPGTPADEADVKITVSTTDVRDQTTLVDYTGELQARAVLRITDRLNGATGNDTATVSDTTYAFTVPCTATGGAANIGSTCSLTTTADALAAQHGARRASARSGSSATSSCSTAARTATPKRDPTPSSSARASSSLAEL